VVRPLWQDLRQDVMARLDQISVDELCLRANEVGITSEGRTNLDFSI
jgi:hypothetical protein